MEVSARLRWHIATLDKTIARAARGILPVWRTTPTVTLLRDAGLPSAASALEEARLRFATHIDEGHPLASRTVIPNVARGRGAGQPQRLRTKVQLLGSLLPEIPRTSLVVPHYSPGCRTDPTPLKNRGPSFQHRTAPNSLPKSRRSASHMALQCSRMENSFTVDGGY